MNEDNSFPRMTLKPISGFKELGYTHNSKYWYIIDCTYYTVNILDRVIGGYHHSYKDLLAYAQLNYTGIYK